MTGTASEERGAGSNAATAAFNPNATKPPQTPMARAAFPRWHGRWWSEPWLELANGWAEPADTAAKARLPTSDKVPSTANAQTIATTRPIQPRERRDCACARRSAWVPIADGSEFARGDWQVTYP